MKLPPGVPGIPIPRVCQERRVQRAAVLRLRPGRGCRRGNLRGDRRRRRPRGRRRLARPVAVAVGLGVSPGLGVAVGAAVVAVGCTGMAVAGTSVGTGVAVGCTGMAVGGTAVAVGSAPPHALTMSAPTAASAKTSVARLLITGLLFLAGRSLAPAGPGGPHLSGTFPTEFLYRSAGSLALPVKIPQGNVPPRYPLRDEICHQTGDRLKLLHSPPWAANDGDPPSHRSHPAGIPTTPGVGPRPCRGSAFAPLD